MTLHLPWLELSILTPIVGALWLLRRRSAELNKRHASAIAAATLCMTVGAWLDFRGLHTWEAHDRYDLVLALFGRNALLIDELSAPLVALAAALYLVTTLATPRTKVKRFSFAGTLVSEAILLATLSCRHPLGLTVLLILGTIPPWFELRARGRPAKLYAVHMTLFGVLLLAGRACVDFGSASFLGNLGTCLLSAAVLLRCGIVPFHLWMTDLFEHATFGTALLFTTPLVGAYAALRLVFPIAPDWLLGAIALLSLVTAVYASGMALVQREARRFFCYLFLSHASLVLVGMDTATPLGLTASLSLMLSVGLGLGGLGLTIRAIEARTGRVSLTRFHGLYEHTPTLAAVFLLAGLASVGFPGTFGFVGTELLVESVVQTYPILCAIVVISASLNGIAVVQAYFRIFTGARHNPSISLRCRLPERISVLVLATLILAGGLYPQPGISSRHHAARELLRARGVVEGPSHVAYADRAEHIPE